MSNTMNIYRITELDNAVKVLFNKEEASADDLRTLIRKLHTSIELLETGKNYAIQYDESVERTLVKLCENQISWIPVDQLKKHQVDGYRNKTKQRFPCVYFIQHHTKPNEIRIGYSNNLRSRLRTHTRNLGADRPKVVAVARTDLNIQLKRLIDHKFRRFHHESKWFDEKPVLNWLLSVDAEVQP